jgi:hypothetical protein
LQKIDGPHNEPGAGFGAFATEQAVPDHECDARIQ